MDKITIEVDDLSKVSDGYHTIEELYDHRCALYLAFMRLFNGRKVISKLHHDGTCYDGWFIAMMWLGRVQISYHMPMENWHLAKKCGAEVVDRAPEWDGHTANDVLMRIKMWLRTQK